MAMSVMKVLSTCVTILLLPVFIVFFVLFMIVWGLLTITMIGPFLQYLCNLSDRKKLDRKSLIIVKSDRFRSITIPAGVHSCSADKSYKVFAIYMEPSTPSQYPPVVIPNGLGATAVLISQMQERLVEHGFAVLSFDRLGVGLSDVNVSKRPPSAVDVVHELDFVMESVLPGCKRWILLGPSMGSIVAQCYISLHSDKVVGFLNMDGLPYPFLKHRSRFVWAAFIYRIYASIIWTGVLRPFIGTALKGMAAMFECKNFPLTVAVAQMNQTNFFSNVGLEMLTMMDCCDMADAAWGRQSILRIAEEDFDILARAPPTVSIEFDEDTKERRATNIRSESELGSSWASEESVVTAIARLRDPFHGSTRAPSTGTTTPQVESSVLGAGQQKDVERPLLSPAAAGSGSDGLATPRSYISCSILGDIWSNLIVRVMSARNHDFGNAVANSFYNQDMRNLAAAEHAKHQLLARNGARTCYPKIAHTAMFGKTDDIVRNIIEIGDLLIRDDTQK